MQATISENLVEAATLMVVGMSFVFVFLTVLIGAVKFISWLDQALPAVAEPVVQVRTKKKAVNQGEKKSDLVAAITAAVHQHRNK